MNRLNKKDKISTEVDLTIEPLRAAMIEYMWKNRLYLQEMAYKCKVSAPLIADIKNGNIGNVSFNKLLQVAAAIDCRITLKVSKAKAPVSELV